MCCSGYHLVVRLSGPASGQQVSRGYVSSWKDSGFVLEKARRRLETIHWVLFSEGGGSPLSRLSRSLLLVFDLGVEKVQLGDHLDRGNRCHCLTLKGERTVMGAYYSHAGQLVAS